MTKFWLDKYNNQNNKTNIGTHNSDTKSELFSIQWQIFKPTQMHAHGFTHMKYPGRHLPTIFRGTDGQTLDGNGRNNILYVEDM
jgi:hypothetical protein